MAKKVKNTSDAELAIPGVGVVPPQGVAEVPDDFHNANFVDAEAAPATAPKKASPKPTLEDAKA